MKQIAAVLSLTLTLCPSLAQSGDSADDQLVLDVGAVIAVPGENPIPDARIVVRGGRIVSVGAVAADVPDTTALDLRRYFALPGLIDVHVHLSSATETDQVLDESIKVSGALAAQHEASRSASYRLINASIAARRTLAAGFTTVRNVGDNGWGLFALRDAIDAGVLPGPRIFTAGNTIRVGVDDGSGACFDVTSCRRATREQIAMGADLIKIQATCSGGRPCGHRNAPPVFLDDELEAIVAVAKSRELHVAAHAHGTAGINAALRAGVDSIEHGSFNDSESRKLFRRNEAYLVPTLSVVRDRVAKELSTAEGEMRDVMAAFVEQHPRRLIAAHKAGVRIAAGSDAGVVPHGDNARELFHYVELGLTPAEAIVAATSNAADLLGESDELGTLAAGKRADILIVDGDPLTDIEALGNVVVVIRNGALYKPEELLRGLAKPSTEE